MPVMFSQQTMNMKVSKSLYRLIVFRTVDTSTTPTAAALPYSARHGLNWVGQKFPFYGGSGCPREPIY